MSLNLSGISIGIAFLAIIAMFLLTFAITTIIFLVERTNTNKPLRRLQSYPWFMASFISLAPSIIILYGLSFSAAIVDYMDHSRMFVLICFALYALPYLVCAWFLKKK